MSILQFLDEPSRALKPSDAEHGIARDAVRENDYATLPLPTECRFICPYHTS
jgi:hypothetical protein